MGASRQPRQFIIDTGPLVAFLDRKDAFHPWTLQQLQGTIDPLLTVESVVSEALFLLKRQALPIHSLADLLQTGELLIPHPPDFADRIPRLLKKYADLPTSMADTALLELSERYLRTPVLTLDSDFRVYRRKDRTKVPAVIPPDPA